jgi:hypothetical protein
MGEVLHPRAHNVRAKVRPIGERQVQGAQHWRGEMWEGIHQEYLEGWMPQKPTRHHVR